MCPTPTCPAARRSSRASSSIRRRPTPRSSWHARPPNSSKRLLRAPSHCRPSPTSPLPPTCPKDECCGVGVRHQGRQQCCVPVAALRAAGLHYTHPHGRHPPTAAASLRSPHEPPLPTVLCPCALCASSSLPRWGVLPRSLSAGDDGEAAAAGREHGVFELQAGESGAPPAADVSGRLRRKLHPTRGHGDHS